MLFSLPENKTVSLSVHQTNEVNDAASQVEITHDGLSTAEIQTGVSANGSMPDEILTTVNNHIGYVLVTPTIVPSTYTITYNTVEPNVYSEHTASGKLIRGAEGIGVVFQGANNVTIRNDFEQKFESFDLYNTSNVAGPLPYEEELFDANNMVEYLGSTLVSNQDYMIIQSSGQTFNGHYIEFPVEPNQVYRVHAEGFFEFTSLYSKTNLPTTYKPSVMSVGSQIGVIDYGKEEFSQNETALEIDVVTDANTLVAGFGMGEFGTNLFVRNISIKKLVPFPSYDQTQGTLYFKWSAVPAGSTIVTLGENTVSVDGSNNIFINTIECGPQSGTNRLAFSYLNGDIIFSLNGSAPAANIEYFESVTSMSYNHITEFSYSAEVLSNTVLVELTNG